jgi:adenosylhomocysteinase
LQLNGLKITIKELEPKVYTLPSEVDLKIAATKLELMGGELEILTKEQIDYLDSWEHGTS